MNVNLSKATKTLLADILQLDQPYVVAPLVGFLVASLNLFGVNGGPYGAKFAAALTALGAVASAVSKTVSNFTVVPKSQLPPPSPPAPK